MSRYSVAGNITQNIFGVLIRFFIIKNIGSILYISHTYKSSIKNNVLPQNVILQTTDTIKNR